MFLWMAVAFLLILGPLIVLHELGHFWAAKRFGIAVEEFGFGLGPKLVTLFRRGGTEYTIRAIPFAAFVRPAGEEDARLEDGLMSAPRKARLSVSAAGPVMNITAALVLMWIAYLFGPPSYTQVSVTNVVPGSPAEASGLQAGDLVLQADEVELNETGELVSYTNSHLGEEIMLLVERDGERIGITVTPRRQGDFNPEIEGPIGIGLAPTAGPPATQGILQALGSAVTDFADVIQQTVAVPGRLARAVRVRVGGGYERPAVPPEDDLSDIRLLGIYSILQIIAVSLQTGILEGYWFFVFHMAGGISMFLGLTNLLPLPALDGGRVAFVVLDWLSEKLFRRKINPEREILVHAVGLVVLLLLMVVITWQDIVNPLIEFPGR